MEQKNEFHYVYERNYGRSKANYKKKSIMETSKYHTRKGYEDLYERLLNERKMATLNINNLSDYHLLCAINIELIRFNLIPFTEDELEMELA